MNEQRLGTVGQLRDFLDGTEEVQFEAVGTQERYAYVVTVVRRLRYRALQRADKGVVMRYLERTTGYSRFHADNGSEYVNHTVAEMLEKLRVEFTRSRPRRSNDNGLAETKNGSIVRKHLGYGHISQRFAADVNAFCRDFLNPYVNFHRPCFFAESITDAKGKTRKRYRLEGMMTPYDKLKSLPGASGSLNPGVTFEALDQLAAASSDSSAAQYLNDARTRLFRSIHRRSKPAA